MKQKNAIDQEKYSKYKDEQCIQKSPRQARQKQHVISTLKLFCFATKNKTDLKPNKQHRQHDVAFLVPNLY